nr:MAG TPA: hypothetical protein [Caudoviricetes sp.]
MKSFSLNEYLKNPNRRIITRDGKEARIICTNKNHHKYSVVALIQKDCAEIVHCYTTEGRYNGGMQSAEDLFFAPEKKEGWVNIYRTLSGNAKLSGLCNSKEEAEIKAENCADYHVTTIKIEWEE